MKFKIEIDCGNAAFDGDDKYPEIERILTELVKQSKDGHSLVNHAIRDINGNVVGSSKFTHE